MKLHSESCERNKHLILEKLSKFLTQKAALLELGSGTGQHAIFMAKNLAHIDWYCSEQDPEYRNSTLAYIEEAKLKNCIPPMDLHTSNFWKIPKEITKLFTANTFHIMSDENTFEFLNKFNSELKNIDEVFIYGPFKIGGEFTSLSNKIFDESLKQKNLKMGIKNLEFIVNELTNFHFQLIENYFMPANNQFLVFRR